MFLGIVAKSDNLDSCLAAKCVIAIYLYLGDEEWAGSLLRETAIRLREDNNKLIDFYHSVDGVPNKLSINQDLVWKQDVRFDFGANLNKKEKEIDPFLLYHQPYWFLKEENDCQNFEAGDPCHAYRAGMEWRHGEREKQDWRLATSSFLEAAKQGHKDAQYEYSKLIRVTNEGLSMESQHHVKGDTFIDDFEAVNEADKWVLRAAHNGQIEAMQKVARKYSLGIGFPQNEDKYIQWMKLLADREDEEAQFNLGRHYFNRMQFKEAFKYFEECRESGGERRSEASFYIAQMCFRKIVDRDPWPYLNASIAKNCIIAMAELIRITELGLYNIDKRQDVKHLYVNLYEHAIKIDFTALVTAYQYGFDGVGEDPEYAAKWQAHADKIDLDDGLFEAER